MGHALFLRFFSFAFPLPNLVLCTPPKFEQFFFVVNHFLRGSRR